MFDFLRRHRHTSTDEQAASVRNDAARDTGPQFREPSGAEAWRALAHRDRAQREDEPGYGGAGYFGSSDSGGQSFNGAQRLYPGDPGYRAHPTRPEASPRIGAAYPGGPRGYERPDDRIRDDLCERLTMHDGIDVSEVSVDVAAGVVSLSGTVEDRYQKRLIEEVADTVFGVRDVENHVRVQRRDTSEKAGDGADDGAGGGRAGDTDPSERTLNLS